jgi:hypothetical protein
VDCEDGGAGGLGGGGFKVFEGFVEVDAGGRGPFCGAGVD